MALCTIHYIGRAPRRPYLVVPAHRHRGWHEFLLIVGGQIETQICGQVLIGRPGDVLFYPRGEIHAERAIGRPMLETLYIGFGGPDFPGWPLLRHDRNGRMRSLMNWMDELRLTGSQRDSQILPVVMETIIHEYGTLAAGPEAEDVSRAKLYAQEHLTEPLRLEDLAAVCGLSRFHFAHRFQKTTGISPMRYLRELRVEKARMLLLSTDWPLKTIAQRAGFADLRHLCRVFKLVTGLPPSALR